MSANGVIDAIEYKQSKAGKAYAKVSINSEAYLVFGKTLDSLRRASEGSTVEFSAKPSDNGDGQILTFLKVNSAGRGPSENAAQRSPAGPTQRSQGRSNDPTIQLSIFYGYAKDLVNSGVIKSPTASHVAVVDLISTTAKELMRRFQQDVTPEPAVTEPEPVTSNPY